ncbi:MAG: hypothetical protein ACD_72C00053G0003 [uncultured bacterium]|nr:MAG: hypothetical protein ACD_72C00053G0003 [uncultured bacterium]
MSLPSKTITNNQTKDQSKPPATLQDIFDAVNTAREENTIEFKDIKEDIAVLKQDVSGLKQDVSGIKATMVTKDDLQQALVKVVSKDYLDDKLSDLKGHVLSVVRKEDTKTVAVIHLLKDKQVFTSNEAESILRLEPFPR